jgi:hypothetical protein
MTSSTIVSTPVVVETIPEKSVAAKRQSTNNSSNNNHQAIGNFKKESCCILCEEVSQKSGDLIKCRGVCQNSFHVECLKLEANVKLDLWKCEECTTGLFKFFHF